MDRYIRDVMQRGVVSCLVSATADKIAKIMLDNNVSAVVVGYDFTSKKLINA